MPEEGQLTLAPTPAQVDPQRLVISKSQSTIQQHQLTATYFGLAWIHDLNHDSAQCKDAQETEKDVQGGESVLHLLPELQQGRASPASHPISHQGEAV
jgi:hypothetical protein